MQFPLTRALPRPTGGRRPRLPLVGTLAWLLLLVVAFLIAYPLLISVVGVFGEQGQDLGSGLSTSLLGVLANTLLMVVGGSAVALTFGTLLAWLNERTDASIGSLGDLLPLAPLMVPPIAGVIGWVVLLDPRVGLLNGWLRGALGLVGISLNVGPFNIYSWPGLVLATSVYLIPYAYLLLSSALRRLDPSLEEASRISRAGPLKTFLRVSAPAVAPTVAAAALLTLIAGVGMFSVPIVIGSGARIDVLSVSIYRLLNTAYPPKTGAALLLAGGMLLVVQLLLAVQRMVLRQGRHATVGGRGFRASRASLGPWRGVARAVTVTYVLVAAVLPVLGLSLVSLQKFWTPAIRWDELSLANYEFVLVQNRDTVRSLLTSLGLGIVGATLTMLLASLIVFHFHDRRGPARRLVDAVTAIPATLPHTVIGVSFLIAFSVAPFHLYGTVFLLLLAYLTMQLPYAARTASASIAEIGPELAEASRVFHASERRTLWRVVLPLAFPSLAAGWVIVFIHMVGELTASALLSGTTNPVIGRVLLDLWNNGSFPQLTALAMVMTVVDSCFVIAMLRLTRRSFDVTVS
jgi:iron(III) transport system permease protein